MLKNNGKSKSFDEGLSFNMAGKEMRCVFCVYPGPSPQVSLCFLICNHLESRWWAYLVHTVSGERHPACPYVPGSATRVSGSTLHKKMVLWGCLLDVPVPLSTSSEISTTCLPLSDRQFYSGAWELNNWLHSMWTAVHTQDSVLVPTPGQTVIS